jgi:hypothetical protein
LIALGGDSSGGWAVSPSGLYAHEVAPNAWTAISTADSFNAVWTSGTDTYLVGAHSGHATVLHLDGAGVPTSQDFNGVTMLNGVWGSASGVWGTGVTQVFAVGSGGAIYHLAAASGSWVPESSGLAPDLFAGWGADGEVFAVGANGTIVHRY